MNKKLIDYVETHVFPLYDKNDKSHQMWHINGVIERSLRIARDYDVDMDMVYTIAAFHDIGVHIDRENHEKESALIFVNDPMMPKFFNEAQIKIIKEAIEDHRASATNTPRSIYGKIVATADKLIIIPDILKSIHLYTLENYPDLDWNRAIDTCYKYLYNKYGPNGYAKVPLVSKDYEIFLENVSKLLLDRSLLASELKKVDIEAKNTYEDLRYIKYSY